MADEHTSSVEHGTDDELVVVEIKFGSLFIHKFRIKCLLQFKISSSPLDTLPTRVSSLLNRYMALFNVLPSSNRVTRSLRQTTQETPLPSDTLHRGNVTPCTLKPLLDRQHIPNASPTAIRPPRLAQLTLHAGFNQPVLRNGHRLPINRHPLRLLDLSTQPKKSRFRSSADSSCTNPTPSFPPISLSVFRGFNVLPRGLLSRTWKQMSALRVHGPLVLG